MSTEHTGWFGSKKKQQEAERQQALAARKERARKQLIQKVNELANDPRFQVLTFDKLNWINPYSGQVVPTPFEPEKAVRDFLLQNRPWTTGKEPLPLMKLTQIVWIHYLMRNMQSEPHLKVFKGDNWLNPFTGRWITDVPLNEKGKPDGKTVTFLSKILNGDPICAQLKMLDNNTLDKLAAGIPQENIFQKEEDVDIYDGIIEEDESLYIDFKNLDQEAKTHTPLTNKTLSTGPIGHDSNTRLIARINAANTETLDTTPVHTVSGSSQQLRSVLLPNLPNVNLANARVHGREEYSDFTYATTMGSGQSLIIHGNISLPDTAGTAPYRDIETVFRKAAQVETDLAQLFKAVHHRVGEHFGYMLGIDCFALIIDTLDMHVELAIAGYSYALAGRMATDSLLNLVGEGGSSLGLSDGAGDDIEPLKFGLQEGDVLAFYTHGISDSEEARARLNAEFVRALTLHDEQNMEALLKSMAELLEEQGEVAGSLFGLSAAPFSDLDLL